MTGGANLEAALRQAYKRFGAAGNAGAAEAFRELERLYELQRAWGADLREFWPERDAAKETAEERT
jgi:hypothetical protein